MRRIAVALTCAGIAAAAVGCGSSGDDGGSTTGGSASSGKTEKVDFRLNWVIAGNHAPFYLAKEKGYWSDCGLDVNMEAGKGSGDTAQLVATGSQEFGLTDAADKPSRDDLVAVFSADKRHWWRGSRRIRLVRPDAKGVYKVRPLPPGAYIITLLADAIPETELLSKLPGLASTGTRVTIAEGEQKVQDLRSARK